MRTDMVVDALATACFNHRIRLDGLIWHTDSGSHSTLVRYTERLCEIGARPSIGSAGDSSGHELAESVNGMFKAELISRQSPGRTVDDVEPASLG